MFLAYSIYNMMDFQNEVIRDNMQENNTTQESRVIVKSTNVIDRGTNQKKDDSNSTFFDDLKDLSFVKFNCIQSVCSSKEYKDIPFDFLLLILKNSSKYYLNEHSVNYNYKSYSVLLNTETRSFLARSFMKIEPQKKDKKPEFNIFGEKRK